VAQLDSSRLVVDMIAPERIHGFLRKATYFRRLDRFDRDEREYKLQLAHDLADAAEAIDNNSDPALELLIAAVKSPADNLIHWTDRPEFLGWLKTDAVVASVSLRRLWDQSVPLEIRLRAFQAMLELAGVTRPGAQLTIASTLLMATSAYDCPPIRTAPFQSAFEDLGVPSFSSSDGLWDRYHKAIGLLDTLRAAATTLLRDRLDAQSVVWCIYSKGWGEVPEDYDPDAPQDQSFEDAALADDPELLHVPPTERLALVQARRGQGKFRDDLWLLWGSCAVTGCRVSRLVHAAHIKPWNLASNPERLDPFNGLLLLPTIHAAFDAGLVAFDDVGTILLSSDLPPRDAAAAGITSVLRLAKIPERTRSYLAEHRRTRFKA
jgi:hypothetical protein